MNGTSTIELNKCWKKIGVWGDSSCQLLENYTHCRNCHIYAKAGRVLLDKQISSSFIEEWTEIVGSSKEQQQRGEFSVAVFRINSEWFAIKTMILEEAVQVKRPHYVPFRSNKFFMGIVNVNGELLLALNFAELLDSKTPYKNEDKKLMLSRRMLVLNFESERFVFTADDFMGIINIVPSQINTLPSTIAKTTDSITSHILNVENINAGLINEDILYEVINKRLQW